jgi:hypothetical protein
VSDAATDRAGDGDSFHAITGLADVARPLTRGEYDRAVESAKSVCIDLPDETDHGFPWISQADLQRALRFGDKGYFRNRLRLRGIVPDKKFAQTALYRIDRIAQIVGALKAKAEAKAPTVQKPAAPARDWKKAAALVADWMRREDVCKLCAPALGLSPSTVRFNTGHFAKLAAFFEQNESGKYRFRGETKAATINTTATNLTTPAPLVADW